MAVNAHFSFSPSTTHPHSPCLSTSLKTPCAFTFVRAFMRRLEPPYPSFTLVMSLLESDVLRAPTYHDWYHANTSSPGCRECKDRLMVSLLSVSQIASSTRVRWWACRRKQ
ncbi:hypothetical protein BKA93DRAFT_781386 [Sparassis latifolia]